MPTRSRQRGLTLLEIVLVLALIVILFALAIPSLTGALGSQRLKKSADLVRSSFSRARVKAMRSGQIQAFRFQIGGNRYTTVTWYADGIASTVDEADSAGAEANASVAGSVNAASSQELPEGITFYTEAQVVDSRAQLQSDQTTPSLGLTGDLDVQWSLPILFYPDGTASDARIVLSGDNGWAVPVDLRGLTGIARVGELERFEELRSDMSVRGVGTKKK
jgi:prepilin-type N-terminal cleavage/methylation domain-containing protein